MNGLEKPFRKKSNPKNWKNRKSKWNCRLFKLAPIQIQKEAYLARFTDEFETNSFKAKPS